MKVRKYISLEVSYSGVDEDMDQEAERIAGREHGDSGIDLDSMVRDLSFHFWTKKAAEAARKRFEADGRFRVKATAKAQ